MNNYLVDTPMSHSDHQQTSSAITNTTVESPSAWMQYGTSPAEITLANAILIGAIATVIIAIAALVQVLVPVMHSNQGKTQRIQSPKK